MDNKVTKITTGTSTPHSYDIKHNDREKTITITVTVEKQHFFNPVEEIVEKIEDISVESSSIEDNIVFLSDSGQDMHSFIRDEIACFFCSEDDVENFLSKNPELEEDILNIVDEIDREYGELGY